MLADLLTWLSDLPQPAVFAVAGLLVLGECTLGLGVVVPGEAPLFVAATTVDGWVEFLAMWATITGCATAGASIGHRIGHRFGARLRHTRLVGKYAADDWDRAAAFLGRRGSWALIVMMFLPVVRSMTPALAGAVGMPYRRFLPPTLVGATVWSGAHIAIGAAAGASARYLEDALGTASWVVVGLLVVAVLGLVVRRRRTRAAGGSWPDRRDPHGADADDVDAAMIGGEHPSGGTQRRR